MQTAAHQTGSVQIEERELKYQSFAETIHLYDSVGEAEAEFSCFSYLAETDAAATARPVAFAFNGGLRRSTSWAKVTAAFVARRWFANCKAASTPLR